MRRKPPDRIRGKRKPGPKKGTPCAKAPVSKTDFKRLAMEARHMKNLARALCDPHYADENPALISALNNFNDDMIVRLKRLYDEYRK